MARRRKDQLRDGPPAPASAPPQSAEAEPVAALMLGWYDRHRRSLPWRAPPDAVPDSYHVWLSEVMLQQTTVAAVAPYFADFLERWPRVEDLAAAPLDDVLAAWAGLGYYARARNLHRCARAVVERHNSRFPADLETLRALPGIGEYTAAAVAAIAFDLPATVVDGNVERVVARLFAATAPLPEVKPELRRLAATLTPAQRPGDFAQAMMDLGATVCTPRRPRCILCPLNARCEGRLRGLEDSLPARRPKPERPRRLGIAFFLVRGDGAILLRRRAETGLLGGMQEVPSTPWRPESWTLAEAAAHAPLKGAAWRLVPGLVRHVFTHFALELQVAVASAPRFTPQAAAEGGRWVAPDDLGAQALPSVMRKVIAHALKKG